MLKHQRKQFMNAPTMAIQKSCGDSSYLFQSLYSLNPLSANSTNWSNTLKQFEETLTIKTP